MNIYFLLPAFSRFSCTGAAAYSLPLLETAK